jgi:hypothetical protein
VLRAWRNPLTSLCHGLGCVPLSSANQWRNCRFWSLISPPTSSNSNSRVRKQTLRCNLSVHVSRNRDLGIRDQQRMLRRSSAFGGLTRALYPWRLIDTTFRHPNWTPSLYSYSWGAFPACRKTLPRRSIVFGPQDMLDR